MVDALSAAVGFMINDMRQMDVVAQNLANVSTPGYRRQLAIGRTFADYLAVSHTDAPGRIYPTMLPALETVQDMQPGVMKSTSGPLDFAIEGNGYFEIAADVGPRYTRQGAFHLDSQGRLVNESGFPVMGVSGEIQLKSSQVSVDGQGRVFEGQRDGQRQVAQLRVVNFADPQKLINVGSGLWAAGDGATPGTDAPGKIRQGFLEGSNVNSTREMVKMIETVRHFEAGQHVVQAYDDMLDRALSKLGEF